MLPPPSIFLIKQKYAIQYFTLLTEGIFVLFCFLFSYKLDTFSSATALWDTGAEAEILKALLDFVWTAQTAVSVGMGVG